MHILMNNCDLAEKYMAKGYRKISNTYQRVARIDRLDWREYMATNHSPWDPEGEGMNWVIGLGPSANDHYRRCHSRDFKSVSASVFKHIKGSGHDPVGYIPLDRRGRPMASKHNIVDAEDLRGKYKIHSINVITGRSSSTANSFHDSFEAALAKSKSIVKRDPDVQMVILKCTHVVQAIRPTVEVVDLDE